MLPQAPDPANSDSRQNTALTCYLSAMLAMAKSMHGICSRAGLLYGDRLKRLPRRLAFDATPEQLEESRQTLEKDLAEYTAATAAWLDTGAGLAQDIVVAIEMLEPFITESASLHTAMLEDLARQMFLSAEVDADSEVRGSLRLGATSLRSYLQRRRDESGESLTNLQSRAQELSEWLSRGDPSNSTDLATGLPNREEFERRLKASWPGFTDVSALLFEWRDAGSAPECALRHAIEEQLANRLTDLLRPRDLVGRWSPNQFAVIFDFSGRETAQRGHRIAEELSGRYPSGLDGVGATICVRVTASVIERLPKQTLAQFLLMMEELQPTETAALPNG